MKNFANIYFNRGVKNFPVKRRMTVKLMSSLYCLHLRYKNSESQIKFTSFGRSPDE